MHFRNRLFEHDNCTSLQNRRCKPYFYLGFGVDAGPGEENYSPDLPPAVEKAVAGQSQGATVRGFFQEKENGQIFYEVELTVDGHRKDVLVDRNGAIVEVEEEIPLGSLSPSMQAGLHGKAGRGKLVKVESLTKESKLVAYEAEVLTNGKKSEVQVGPDGGALDHEE